MSRPLLVVCLAFPLLGVAEPTQQPRDNRRPTATGRATITGTIAIAESARPLRRARVTLTGSELESQRTAITADDGTYVFADLPAGRYSMWVTKEGYARVDVGASRQGRPGRTIVVADGATVRVNQFVPRGAVITGTVLNPDGEPAQGVAVIVLVSQYDPLRGGRRLTPLPNGATTDDRGVYRIFGLAENRYYIAAQPNRSPLTNRHVQVLTVADVRRAMAEVRETRASGRPGIANAPPASVAVEPPPAMVALAPVFHPGTPIQERATAIDLRAGEVRNGVDLQLDHLPLSSVEGTITVPAGLRAQLFLTDAEQGPLGPTISLFAGADDQGRFRFARVPPGTYTIGAVAFAGRNVADAASTSLWAETQVMVSADDLSGVSVTLRPPLSISGRIVTDTGAPLPDLGAIRTQMSFGVQHFGLREPMLEIDGARFSIQGLTPNAFRFFAPSRGIRTPIGRWWLTSVTMSGRELLDAKLELPDSADDMVVTVSERVSQLSGVARQEDGSPATDGVIVVFSTDARYWFHHSRRVAGVPVSSTGQYVVRNLPAGDYRVAFTRDLAPNEWFDPDALKSLVRTSQVVAIGRNETKVLDLAAGR